MNMKDKKYIKEDDLDRFLNTYSLNKLSGAEDVDMANAVFDQDYGVKMSEAKRNKLLNKLGGGSGNGKWTWIGVVLLIVIVSIVLVFQLEDKKEGQVAGSLEDQLKTESTPHSSELTSVLELNEIVTDTGFMKTFANIKDSISDRATVISSPVYAEDTLNVKQPLAVKALFTDQEIKYYEKIKKELVSQLIVHDKKMYTQVRETFIYYKQPKVGVDAFVLRNFSVTNMEYKAFLIDLIKLKNHEALKIAMVKQTTWSNYNCNQLADNYFKSKAYDGFPVVNISPQAVLLFCQWLEQATNKQLLLDDPKAKAIKIRLPFDAEWISSAKIGFAQTPKCEGYQTIFELSEGLVNKAFLKRQEKVQKHDLKKRTVYDNFFELNRYGMSEIEILDIYKSADTIQVFYPDGLKNIGKVAHVSEFIQNGSSKVIVFGSCWKSKKEYAKMLSEFKNQSASPFIGFRYVVENEQLETYKNPFW
ncbi:MAG: hypothetical protein COB15_09960 [Flavobacteriales bacterium]|nr:MAG: hypothetical protein COB15_09960 [Flavobacteriales bacterium]